MTQSAATTIRWSFLGLGARIAAQTLSAFVIARLLGPHLYGVVGLATVYVSLMTLLLTQGMGQSLVKAVRPSPVDFGTVHLTSLGTTALLAGVTVALAGPVADYFDAPELGPMLAALALGLVLKAETVVPQARLVRDLRFGVLARAESVSSLFGAALGIGATLLGADVWGYVILTISTDAVLLVMVLGSAGGSPWRWSRHSFRTMLGFTSSVTGTQLIGFLARNADNLLVARVLGNAALGYYLIAYRLMRLPITTIVMVVSRALFPHFSRYRDDSARLSGNFLAATRAMALLSIPLMALVLVFAEEIIGLLFGQRWDPAVLPTQILCVAAMVQTLTSMMTPAMLATGHEKEQLRWTASSTVVMLAGFAVSVRFGIAAVALAYTLVSLLFFPLAVRLMCRAVGTTTRRYLDAVRPGVELGLVTFAAGAGIRQLFESGGASAAAKLLLGGAGCIAVTFVVAWFAYRDVVLTHASLLKSMLRTTRDPIAGSLPEGRSP